MEKRNLTPLRNVLVRYLVVCGGGSIVILLVWWGLFMSLIRNGFLLPPVTGAQVCSEARDYAATATVETFDPNAIDPLCRYAILQAGTAHVLQTNMTASQLKKASRSAYKRSISCSFLNVGLPPGMYSEEWSIYST